MPTIETLTKKEATKANWLALLLAIVSESEISSKDACLAMGIPIDTEEGIL